MRERLLDATVATLYDRGYARTTTTEIARRARVSRGAQLHHFPTKAELVIEALTRLFAQRTEEFRALFTSLPAHVDRVAAGIELLWSMLSSPSFYAWLELIVAARTDGRLRKAVLPLGRHFVATVQDTFRSLIPSSDQAIVPHFAVAILEGLAVEKIVMPDSPHIAAIIDRMRMLGRLVLPALSKEQG
jgi:AcrR family transcriptional regulator